MTCIATDGKTIAADSRTCVEDLIVSEAAEKLVEGADGSILGTAGPAGPAALVREWFRKGENYEEIPKLRLAEDEEVHALILRPNGDIDFLEQNFTLVRLDAPAAIGSGTDVAIGAMLAGKDPFEAVKLVSKRITTVGGPVRYKRRKGLRS